MQHRFLSVYSKSSTDEANARFPETEMQVFDISFEAIRDDEERLYLQSLPTSFVLPDEAVDRLRNAGSELLRQSPVFHQVLQDLGAELDQ